MYDEFNAAVLVEQNKPLSLVKLNFINPGSGQVRVKMITAGLCGAQINEIEGVKGPDKFLPHLMGHEGFGQVDMIGTDVTHLSPGDYVVLHWRPGLGMDVFGGVYEHPEMGRIGSGPVTTFSDYTVVSENRCTKVDFEEDLAPVYPLMGCALSTAYGLVNLETNPMKGNRILISGGGGLGLSIAAMLKAKGVKHVDIYEKNNSKKEMSSAFSSGFSDQLKDLNENFYDFIFDTTGDVNVLEKLFTLLNKGADLIMVGQPRVGSKLTINDPLKFFDHKRLFATQGGQFDPAKHMRNLNDAVNANKDLFKSLISHNIPLSKVNEGFELMKSGTARRIIINFGE
ncbi:alcohol dehydrogenase catalytic domain-containing protein [Planktomarina temperata]|nr:alcohol dehydrogenase catalytic domain-containing protein [Planktomarina temperata]